MNKNLFLKSLKSTMETNGHTQKDLENKYEIDQSQISKILNGDFSRKGKAVKSLMKYSNYNEFVESNLISEEINKAISEVWDGSEQMEKKIAAFIRQLGKTLS
jgi:hypothetical protein